MIFFDNGDVLKINREHYAFRVDGEMVALNKEEILIVVNNVAYSTHAIRVETGEVVIVNSFEIPDYLTGQTTTYTKIWP